MSEIVWSWDGSAVARTTSSGAVWTVGGYKIGPALPSTNHKQIDLLDALIDTTETVLTPVRTWELSVRADVSGITAANVERKLVAGWEELTAAFDPTNGVAKLQAARVDTAGAAVTRYLLGEIAGMESYTPRTGDSGGLWDTGAYEGAGGHIVYVVRGTTVFPYWIGSALLTLDTAPATAELAVGASTDSVVINNAGARWVGIRIDVDSVAGSVTSWKIENSANGDVVTVTNAGGFANTDYVDMLATDPRVITRADSDNKFTGSGHNRLRLATGSQTLTSTRLTGTGTCTLSLSWPFLARSL